MINRILERLEAVEEECISEPTDDYFFGKFKGIVKAKDIVQEVAKEYDWIPVGQRLPEEITKDCLVTLENGAVFQAQYAKYHKEFRMVVPYHGIIRFHEDNPVIAWCELPAPYQKGE